MKMHILRRAISMLLVLCMVTLPLCTDTVYATGEDSQEVTQEMTTVANLETNVQAQLDAADPVVDNGANAQSAITATLYNAGGVDIATDSVVLTESGNTSLSGIDLDANLLEVHWTFMANQTHTLQITVPAGLYIVENSWTMENEAAGSLLQDPTFTPLDLDTQTDGLQQGTGVLSNAQTGTLTYTTLYIENSTMVKDETIQLWVGVDRQLWDKGGLSPEIAIDGTANAIEIRDDSDAVRILSDVYTSDKADILLRAGSSKTSGSMLVTHSNELQRPIQFYLLDQNYARYEWAYKQIVVTYTVTYTAPNGNSQTIPVQGVNVPNEPIPNVAVPNIAKYGKLDFDEETQTAIITDYYTESVELMVIGEPEFYVTEELEHNGIIRVSADITLIGYNGSVRTENGVNASVTYKSEDMYEISFAYTNYSLSGENKGLQISAPAEWYGEDDDAIDYLGTLAFRNSGVGATPEGMRVEVVFDTEYDTTAETLATPRMLVSSFRLFALAKATVSDVTVEYVYQENGVWKKGVEIVKGIKAPYRNTTHGALLCLGAGKYLTKISYTMPEIPGDTYLYRSGSISRDESGGTFHGRMLTEDTNVQVTSVLTLYDSDSAGGAQIAARSCKTQVRDKNQVKYIGYLDAMDSISADAGSNVSIDLTLSAYDYGYTASTYVPSPTLFVVLPEGITVNGASFAHKKNDAKVSVANSSITHWSHSDGNIVYKIDLGTAAAFGGFRIPNSAAAKLGFVDDRYCYVKLDLHLSAGLRASSYNLRDMLTLTTQIPETTFYSTYGQAAGSGGVVATYAKEYTHGVRDEDNVTHTFSSFVNNEDAQLQIFPLTNGILFTPAVSETGEGGDWRIGVSNTSAVRVAPGDTYFYRVTAQNNSDTEVPRENTALYIPIPHPNQQLPNAMGGQNTNSMGVRLTGPVEIADGATATAWDIRYAVAVTEANFNNGTADFTGDGNTYAQWYTAEEIENDLNLYWEDVLCIKAALRAEYINANNENAYPIDASDIFTLKLRMTPGVVGESLSYASATWNLYNSAGATPAGGVLFNTAFAKVIRGKRVELREVSLVSNPDTGTSNEQLTLENYAGVAFNITDVLLSDVTLQTAAVIEANRKDNSKMPDAAVQDATFGVRLKLNSNATADLAAVNPGHGLGSSEKYAENELYLYLSCYRQFLDAATPRYVDVTVSDPDGSVVITYRVNIQRTLKLLEPQTGIIAGFYPNGGFGNPNVATISRDGVATAQFVFNNYNTATNGDFSIVLYPAFGSTPSLTLIDMTDPAAPKYYSYKANSKANGETNIPLTYFENMDGSGPYTQPIGTVEKVNYVLVIDLTNAAYTNNYTIRMNMGSTAGSPLNLKAVAGMVRFTWDAPVCDNELVDGEMDLALTLNSTTVNSDANHLWMGRSESVKVRITNGTGLFPVGSYLTDGVNLYPACPGGGYIKVPVGNVSAQGGTRALSLTLYVPVGSVSTDTVSLYFGYMVAPPYHKSIATACGSTRASTTKTVGNTVTQSNALRVDGDSHLVTDEAIFTVYRTDGATDLNWKAYCKTEDVYSDSGYLGSASVANANTFTLNASTWNAGTYLVEFTTIAGEKSYYTLIVLE